MAVIVENKDVASGNKAEIENDDETNTDIEKSVECSYGIMVKEKVLRVILHVKKAFTPFTF